MYVCMYVYIYIHTYNQPRIGTQSQQKNNEPIYIDKTVDEQKCECYGSFIWKIGKFPINNPMRGQKQLDQWARKLAGHWECWPSNLGLNDFTHIHDFPCISLYIYIYTYMEVSWNGGTPKSSILIGFSIKPSNYWVPPFMETPIYITSLQCRFCVQ